MFTNKFGGLEIKKSKVHEFMRDKRNLSMKQTACWPEARTSKENVQKRYDWSSSGAIWIWIFQETVFLSMKLVLVLI